MHLVFDFDGTITQQDTIGELARSAIELQRNKHGHDLQASWDQVVQSYVADYRHYRDNHPSPEDTRKSLDEEIHFLSGMKNVEETSLERVAKSRIFAGLDAGTLSQAGADAVREGRIKIRDGFVDMMNLAGERGWGASVISVNWSRAFIRGALQPHTLEVIANEPATDGVITGPEFLGGRMTNMGEKREALRHLVKEKEGKVVYFGDSTTDMECLLAGGVVISQDEESSLLRTLRRVGVSVPHVGEKSGGKIFWARDFREVLESGLLNEYMCLYGRVEFSCSHERWGLCVKPCHMAQDFQAQRTEYDCVIKRPHVPTSRRLQRRCDKCNALDDKFTKATKCIQDLAEKVKKMEYGEKKKKKGEEAKREQGLEIINEDDEGA
ncbi:hypothetical protein F66182_4341 [Fusarium sp. NRRL 66182]|nr:hypothetical protein F66182_4341 [Fusarium sp. NRRL 66182]